MSADQLALFDAAAPSGGPVALRQYQQDAIQKLEVAFRRGFRAPLLVLPTAAGKTVVAADFIRTRAAGTRVLFLAPRRELVHQASAKLTAAGVRHGVILAGADHLRRDFDAVQVASIDTLRSRLRRKRLDLGEFHVVFMDEAHLAVTKTRKNLLARWPEARLIGLTATPTRKDGRALGVLFDALVEPASAQELTLSGYLSPARYFSISEPDLTKVRTLAGDYRERDLSNAMNRPQLVGDVVATWLERAPSRRTVVFCCSIEHSIALAGQFLRMGVSAEHVDAKTPQHQRESTFRRFSDGQTQVLTNCFLASYGFDLPELSCVVLARPTKSLMLYLQMIGRGLRVAPGKSDCMVLDHSGCVHRFGFAADERSWTLDGVYALVERRRAAPEKRESQLIHCDDCCAVFRGMRVCPECGAEIIRRGRAVSTSDGDLVELGVVRPESIDHLTYMRELLGYAAEKGYQNGWASHMFQERFGHWPPFSWKSAQPLAPTTDTRRWVLSRVIRHAKTKRRGLEASQLNTENRPT